MEQLLEEVDASVLVTDLHGFQRLAEQRTAVELGMALAGYYAHVGGVVERRGGRLVKFVGDGVLGAFLGREHRAHALAALAELDASRAGWLADNAKVGLPPLDYAAGAASGEVLAGELGTDRIRFWDVLGAPVNLAFRLCALAADRGVPQLVHASTVEGARTDGAPAVVEVEAAEIAGRRQRLFRLAQD